MRRRDCAQSNVLEGCRAAKRGILRGDWQPQHLDASSTARSSDIAHSYVSNVGRLPYRRFVQFAVKTGL